MYLFLCDYFISVTPECKHAFNVVFRHQEIPVYYGLSHLMLCCCSLAIYVQESRAIPLQTIEQTQKSEILQQAHILHFMFRAHYAFSAVLVLTALV